MYGALQITRREYPAAVSRSVPAPSGVNVNRQNVENRSDRNSH
eukprot:COSAG03_NODE_277_length_9517_cov_112.780739_5_plen_43_part_00